MLLYEKELTTIKKSMVDLEWNYMNDLVIV